MSKVKAYCLRFKSVLCRRIKSFTYFLHLFIWPWRSCFVFRRKFVYDESVEEYFVQTADTVKVKKSELEAYQKMEGMDPGDVTCLATAFLYLVSLTNHDRTVDFLPYAS